MNILIVHPCKGFHGGAEEVVVQLHDYLRASGHEVRIMTKNAPQSLIDREAKNCRALEELYYRTQESIDQWADVVNVHNPPAPLMTFPKKVPTVYMCNEPMELFTTWRRKPIEAANRWWVRKSHMKVVVADKYNKRRFEKIYGIKPMVVPYGVDCEFWAQGKRTKRPGTVRLLQVGSISKYKNQAKSIQTFELLLEMGVRAYLTLAGGIGDYEYYKGLTKTRITLLGQVTKEQVRDLFYKHDVLLHPVEEQGGWLVPFEAMCAGLPVLVGPEFSAQDTIKRNNLGLVAEDMASAIKDGDYKKLDTEAIRLWVKENLPWEKFGERMEGLFERESG